MKSYFPKHNLHAWDLHLKPTFFWNGAYHVLEKSSSNLLYDHLQREYCIVDCDPHCSSSSCLLSEVRVPYWIGEMGGNRTKSVEIGQCLFSIWLSFGVYVLCLLTFGKYFVPFHAWTTMDKNMFCPVLSVNLHPVRFDEGLYVELTMRYALWKRSIICQVLKTTSGLNLSLYIREETGSRLMQWLTALIRREQSVILLVRRGGWVGGRRLWTSVEG